MHVYCGLMEPRWREIADEDLVRDAPRMRYLIADRLEQIWNACEPHVTGDAARPDHRYVETGLRALVRLHQLYRLDTPAVAAAPEMTPVDTARMVETALAELESRIKPS
jgi:hypothetical protein